jgi:hypothetical protein
VQNLETSPICAGDTVRSTRPFRYESFDESAFIITYGIFSVSSTSACIAFLAKQLWSPARTSVLDPEASQESQVDNVHYVSLETRENCGIGRGERTNPESSSSWENISVVSTTSYEPTRTNRSGASLSQSTPNSYVASQNPIYEPNSEQIKTSMVVPALQVGYVYPPHILLHSLTIPISGYTCKSLTIPRCK